MTICCCTVSIGNAFSMRPFAPTPSILISRCVHGNNRTFSAIVIRRFAPSFISFPFSFFLQTSILFYLKRRDVNLEIEEYKIGIVLVDTIIPVVLVACHYVSVLNARLIACNRLHTPRMEKFSSLCSENTVCARDLRARSVSRLTSTLTLTLTLLLIRIGKM